MIVTLSVKEIYRLVCFTWYFTKWNILFPQLQREPRPFPTLEIAHDVPDIDSFSLDKFKITGYDPHPTIKMQMAV